MSGTVLLLAGGGVDMLAGQLPAGGVWSTSTLADATSVSPALVMTGAASGLGVIRSEANAGELRFTTWSAGAWSPFSGVAALVTTRAAPSAAALGGAAHVLFHGDNFKHYYASYQASWSPTADPVGGAAAQSFGPSPAAVAALPNEILTAFAGDNGDIYTQSRAASWAAAKPFNLGNVASATPAVIEMTAGAEVMLVFVRKTDAKVMWSTRVQGSWSGPLEIPQALSADRPALSPLAGGGAVVAFRGTNSSVYTSIYTPGAAQPWSAPSTIGAFSTPTSPALARGVSPAEAELAFIDGAGGSVVHARLMAGVWSVPTLVGGLGRTSIALASAP